MPLGPNDVLTHINWPNIYVMGRLVRGFEVDPTAFRGAADMPLVDEYSNVVRYEKRSSIKGMTQPTMLDTLPRNIGHRKVTSQALETGYFKETSLLKESDLLYLRQVGSQNLAQRAAENLVVDKLQEHNLRLETLLEWLRWKSMMGVVHIQGNGVDREIDFKIPANQKIDLTTAPGAVTWDDPTAKIRKNLLDWSLLFRGSGAGKPKVWMNQLTSAAVIQNAEIIDLVKQSTLATQIGIDTVNRIIIPIIGTIDTIEVYDEGYIDDNDNFTPFIPDGYVIMKARGPASEKFGDIATTISLHNGGVANPQPGKFALFKAELGEDTLLPQITVGAGIYCVPRVYHPEWLVVAKVF